MLPRARRLARADFPRVYRAGRRVRSSSLTVWYLPPAGRGAARVGIVVSTKVAKQAVRRNLYRRRLATCLGSVRAPALTAPHRIIIAATPRLGGLSFAELRAELSHTLGRIAVPPPR